MKKYSKKKIRVGRPLKFKTVEQLQKLIDRYFRSCWAQKIDMSGNPIYFKDKRGHKTNKRVMVQVKPYTITGLAVALDTSRESLLDYENSKHEDIPKGSLKEFSDTIKRAKERCHNYAEDSLYIGKNPTGAIFNLKNNYGWRDKSEVENSGKVIWSVEDPK